MYLTAGSCIPEHAKQRRGHRNLAFFFVLGFEPELLLGGDADTLPPKVTIAPRLVANLLVTFVGRRKKR